MILASYRKRILREEVFRGKFAFYSQPRPECVDIRFLEMHQSEPASKFLEVFVVIYMVYGFFLYTRMCHTFLLKLINMHCVTQFPALLPTVVILADDDANSYFLNHEFDFINRIG